MQNVKREWLSEVYNPAICCEWIKNNPIATVRQSAKRPTVSGILTVVGRKNLVDH